ncbi:hypothetical protein H0H87_010123 [Tephrocybe sp. NHM501043]|nr:hypothetical protein H0H87_010123 [Tephrocybe sp. NHM501043]
MPTVLSHSPVEKAFRVLVTGFGPFHEYEVNPSWLAVKPLHDTTISPSITAGGAPGGHRPIHISALEIPVSYNAVLAVVPGLHLRPPVLPKEKEPFPLPPSTGYDFIFHVGVAPWGPLKVERQGHKVGYKEPDVDKKLAPLAHHSSKVSSREPVVRLGADDVATSTRGFGINYEAFPDELQSELDVVRLIQELKQSGLEIATSMDAGHYLCDFIYYCSLAEAKRNANYNERQGKSQVLFLHCPPINQPHTTAEVTEVVRRIICWVCKEIEMREDTEKPEGN